MATLFVSGRIRDSSQLQWAPLLTNHDPNPPIALEGDGSQEINLTGIASAEAFGTPSVTTTINPTGIASAEAFGTLSVFGPMIAPASIASAEAFGNPSITISVFPDGIASAEAFGTFDVSTPQLIIPAGIASEEAFGAFSVLLYPPPPPSYALSVRCEYRSCGDVDDFSEYSLQDGSERTANSSSLCVTRTCSVLPDIDIYNIQTGNIAPASNVSLSCATRTCADSGVPDVEIYNLQDALFFNGTPLSFLIQCPNGQVCPPGVFPRLFTYPPGTFYFPQPPPGPCSTNIVLQMRGCESTVTRVLPCGSSPALINAAAQQIIQEVAEQQANCDAEILFTRTLGIVLSDLPTWACIDSDFDQIVTGFVPASVVVPNPSLWVINQFDFVGNSQPLWMSAAQTPGGSLILSGSPTSFGPVSFTVQAVAPPPSAGDPYAVGQKTYTIEIIGISTASPLPNAVAGEEFSQTFAATGFGSTPLWGLAYGSLPDWMAFNTNTGTIYGTPPIEDDGATYTFAIFVQDGERQCVKGFELSVGTTLSDDLIQWYPLTEPSGSRYDSSGSYPLDEVISPVGVQSGGPFGNSAVPRFPLPGTNQYLSTNTPNSGINFTNSSYSVCAWVFIRNPASSGIIMIFQDQTVPTSKRWIVLWGPSQIVWRIRNSGGFTSATVIPTPVGSWFLYTVTFDVATQVLLQYINDTEISSDSPFPIIDTPINGSLRIGIQGTGLADDFAIQGFGTWSRALTPEEVVLLYNDGDGTPL